MRDDWDRAAREHYGYKDVDELEKAWLLHLKQQAQPEKDRPASELLPPPTSGTKASRPENPDRTVLP
jgi:hypothetical protein